MQLLNIDTARKVLKSGKLSPGAQQLMSKIVNQAQVRSTEVNLFSSSSSEAKEERRRSEVLNGQCCSIILFKAFYNLYTLLGESDADAQIAAASSSAAFDTIDTQDLKEALPLIDKGYSQDHAIKLLTDNNRHFKDVTQAFAYISEMLGKKKRCNINKVTKWFEENPEFFWYRVQEHVHYWLNK